jgi:hypothetical protein
MIERFTVFSLVLIRASKAARGKDRRLEAAWLGFKRHEGIYLVVPRQVRPSERL